MTSTLKERIEDGTATKEELIALYQNMEQAALVLRVYADKKNWRQEWFNNPKGYGWVFTNAKFYFGQADMPPEELMERVARTTAPIVDSRFDDKGEALVSSRT